MRGNIIHNALHNLLTDKPSRQQIQDWTADEMSRRVGSAIDSALAVHVAQADPVLQRLINIERGRLRQLLRDFIHAEVSRPEFKVAAVEKKLDYEKFGIRLGLRIDRIDCLADGRMLVVDYKTGSPKTFLNRNRELKDLQLMVYADALSEEIGGLAFINVDSREITYKAAGGGWNEAEEDAWEETLQSWRSEVHHALEALATGDARINILQSASDGRSLNILSRLEELKRV
jgi:RecB family exonuclease